MLQVIKIMMGNQKGKQHVLRNEKMLEFTCISMAKENTAVANEAALTLTTILTEPCKFAFTINKNKVCKS